MIYIHLQAGRSTNGNKRACFVVIDADGDIRDVIDEGCAGDTVRTTYPDAKQGPSFTVKPGERRALLSQNADWRVVAAAKRARLAK